MNPTDAACFDPHESEAKDHAAKWIDATKAAQLLGISSRSIQRRCHAGKLPARRSQGERGEVWEIEAGAIEGARQNEGDGDTGSATTTATERQLTATATTTRATGGRRVAVNSPVSHSNQRDRKSDGDSDTATNEGDSDGDTRQSVALEAERLKAQLEASRAETARERELNAFLKTQIEEGNRNAAELRKALNEALKIAPRQLTAQSGSEALLQTKSTSNRNEPKGTDELSADELFEMCRRICPQ